MLYIVVSFNMHLVGKYIYRDATGYYVSAMVCGAVMDWGT